MNAHSAHPARRTIGPADLYLPPTHPIDVTALIAAAAAAQNGEAGSR